MMLNGNEALSSCSSSYKCNQKSTHQAYQRISEEKKKISTCYNLVFSGFGLFYGFVGLVCHLLQY